MRAHVLAWLLLVVLGLIVSEVRLSHGEHRPVTRQPLVWYRDSPPEHQTPHNPPKPPSRD
jgi:hypothetical protein